jgi:hypothetical protein
VCLLARSHDAKRSSSSSPTGRSSSTLFCDGCQKPFKRIQSHLSHNPACNSVYASRKSLIDPYAGVGGTVIDGTAKAAQYHASLSSPILMGGSTGQQSRSRQKFPAPFEFGAQNAGETELCDGSVRRALEILVRSRAGSANMIPSIRQRRDH